MLLSELCPTDSLQGAGMGVSSTPSLHPTSLTAVVVRPSSPKTLKRNSEEESDSLRLGPVPISVAGRRNSGGGGCDRLRCVVTSKIYGICLLQRGQILCSEGHCILYVYLRRGILIYPILRSSHWDQQIREILLASGTWKKVSLPHGGNQHASRAGRQIFDNAYLANVVHLTGEWRHCIHFLLWNRKFLLSLKIGEDKFNHVMCKNIRT